MFAIGGINFANGVYHNGMINGAEVMIMQSAENADNVINDFEKAFSAGMDPNNVVNQIMRERHLSSSDFTEFDMVRMKRKIEAIYNAENTPDRRKH